MRRGTSLAVGVGAGLLLTALAGCGGGQPVAVSPASASASAASVSPVSERARLLASCPAEAPAWETGRVPVTEDAQSIARGRVVDRAAEVARTYLAALPADQVGVLRVDAARLAVVVQVTRDADRVRRDLQDRFGAEVRAEVETVRYSKVELERAEETIRGIQGLEWNGMGTGANARVEVQVPGDAAAAQALIARSLDPCMFTVKHGVVTLDG
jgi:hypothetical protein